MTVYARVLSSALIATLALALALAVGCGSDSPAEDPAASPEVVKAGEPGEAEPAEATEAVAGEEAPKAEAKARATEQKARPAPQRPAGSSRAAAERFKFWAPVHSFLGATVVDGEVLSGDEAIVMTKENHVGVTTDAGGSWGFIRHTTGKVKAVSGNAGGPYVAVGAKGYVSVSQNGKSWTELPRYTSDDLIDVVVGGGLVVAIGKKGSYVRLSPDGADGTAGILPDKFKASSLVKASGNLIAIKGKKGYATPDGKSWVPLETLPELPSTKSAATRNGLCSLGKVGKKKGIVCTVSGVGHGLGKGVAFVQGKSTLAFTRDGGSSWSVANAPVSKVSGVIGGGSGPWYAFGAKGGLAVTSNGSTWAERPLNTTKTLRAGIVDGANIVVVGDSGTIVRSGNGGESWEVLEPPVSGALKQIYKQGSQLIVPAGRSAIASSDGGATWLEITDPEALAAIPGADKVGSCDARLPEAGEVCKYTREVGSPLGLPNAKAFTFSGDTGLAMGDAGLVMFTKDGGATWNASSGFPLRKVQGFAVRGKRIVAVGGKTIIVSVDGGSSFKEAQLPKKTGTISDVLIAADGSVYAAGGGGTIIKSEGNLDLWLRLNTGEKNRTSFTSLHEVAGVLYAAGKKGELYRSHDAGATWRGIPTGVSNSVQKMAGEGNTIIAVTWASRGSGNLLLRSNDGGLHFFVQSEVSDSGRVWDLSLEGGKILYDERVSDDYGATWSKGRDNFWGGAEDLDDGSGMRLAIRWAGGTERLLMVGADKDDWTFIDSAYAKGARLNCDKVTGCWMVTGGEVSRPL